MNPAYAPFLISPQPRSKRPKPLRLVFLDRYRQWSGTSSENNSWMVLWGNEWLLNAAYLLYWSILCSTSSPNSCNPYSMRKSRKWPHYQSLQTWWPISSLAVAAWCVWGSWRAHHNWLTVRGHHPKWWSSTLPEEGYCIVTEPACRRSWKPLGCCHWPWNWTSPYGLFRSYNSLITMPLACLTISQRSSLAGPLLSSYRRPCIHLVSKIAGFLGKPSSTCGLARAGLGWYHHNIMFFYGVEDLFFCICWGCTVVFDRKFGHYIRD